MEEKMSHSVVGNVGEYIAMQWLKRRGFLLLARNYRTNTGELDVVMQKDGVVHCFEVKTRRYSDNFPVQGEDAYRPEEKYTRHKHRTVWRTFEQYLYREHGTLNVPHALHLLCVELDATDKRARVWVEWEAGC
jgi:Holliday junction resolvase-like predicted endonuclease